MKKFKVILMVVAVALLGMSCHNGNSDFDDFEFNGVYFGSQYPVRTIVLGEDIFDNSLDNAHKFEIYANLGGMYVNKNRVEISVAVDNAICDNLYFDDTTSVQPLPASYYTLASDKIVLDKTTSDAVEVSLSDAFFADPLALSKNYVLPLKMTSVSNADSILSGVAKVDGAQLSNPLLWDVQPKNFVLYALKFINKYHGNYLRRGVDVLNDGTTTVRRETFVENDEVSNMYTTSLDECIFPVKFPVLDAGNMVPKECELALTFNEAGECTISSASTDFTATGSGKFVIDGEKNSWGNKERNALYLEYELTHTAGTEVYQTKDTLVVRDRGVAPEAFVPVCK